MKKSFRLVVSLLVSLILIASSVLPAFAAQWNGSTADGTVGDSSTVTGGYGIKGAWADEPNKVLGFRFSFYNVETGETKGRTIDIYKHEYSDYITWNKFDAKYNKVQLREKYNNDDLGDIGLTTKFDVLDTYTDYDMYLEILGLEEYLPEYTSELEEWQDNDYNLIAVLRAMGFNGKYIEDFFDIGDYLLVEPIFPVYIDKAWFVLTVTEMAVLGSDPDVNGVGGSYDGSISAAVM